MQIRRDLSLSRKLDFADRFRDMQLQAINGEGVQRGERQRVEESVGNQLLALLERDESQFGVRSKYSIGDQAPQCQLMQVQGLLHRLHFASTASFPESKKHIILQGSNIHR